MGALRRKQISITANYLHPFTLKDTEWTVKTTVSFPPNYLFLLSECRRKIIPPRIWLRNIIIIIIVIVLVTSGLL